MKTRTQVLHAIAGIYQRRKAGRTGQGTQDVFFVLEKLLAECGCSEGASRADAEEDLIEAEAAGILERIPVNKRDPAHIDRIRFKPAHEAALYTALEQSSPRQTRQELSDQFQRAGAIVVPVRWEQPWKNWCARMQAASLAGESMEPFDRYPSNENQEVLELLPKLLAWQGESLVRFASCQLCGNSKRLESLASREDEGEFAGQLRGKLGRLLETITGGSIKTLDDLGIVSNPRSVLLHGPLRLLAHGAWIGFGLLKGAVRVSQADIEEAEQVCTVASRCITIENETMFHEWAKLQSGELLICTSFPGSATVALLRRLPETIECWHFGDTDQAGFEILRVLRKKSGRDFKPLHMERARGAWEQESLGRPTGRSFPFYSVLAATESGAL